MPIRIAPTRGRMAGAASRLYYTISFAPAWRGEIAHAVISSIHGVWRFLYNKGMVDESEVISSGGLGL